MINKSEKRGVMKKIAVITGCSGWFRISVTESFRLKST